jgi:hypothetical protein
MGLMVGLMVVRGAGGGGGSGRGAGVPSSGGRMSRVVAMVVGNDGCAASWGEGAPWHSMSTPAFVALAAEWRVVRGSNGGLGWLGNVGGAWTGGTGGIGRTGDPP